MADPAPDDPPLDGVESRATHSDELLHRLTSKSSGNPRYRLQGEVARGGMGAILRVWDEELRRNLAMKVVLDEDDRAVDDDQTRRSSPRMARFLEEAQVTGQLDHPGIVPVHELGIDAEGRVYFTMKLVKGRDLKQVFDLVFEGKEGWNETRALSVVLKVCEAMGYAHAKGVIHRDLKPPNVMVGGYGEVFVMDWGLARVLGRRDLHDLRLLPDAAGSRLTSVRTERREEREDAPDSPLVTMDGDVMGTPAYMPPEQARGEIERLSPRSDVYSIGAMLYHLLARQVPYVPAGARMTNRTVLARVVEGPPKPLHEIRRDIPAEVAAICEKAMARDPDARYASTLELADDLRAYLEHRVVAAYETGAWAETRKWVERNKPLAASLAAAVLIAIGGLTWVTIVQTRARTVIEGKNEDLLRTNRSLAEAREAAEANARQARANEETASRRTEEVLSLSAVQDLAELERRASTLWPPVPELIPAYDAWIAEARALIDGRPADPARGLKARPSLAQHRARLVELRQRALPLSEAQREADRRAHPGYDELVAKSARRTWLSRMLGDEPWPADEGAPGGGAEPAADPAEHRLGEEIATLARARAALDAAPEAPRVPRVEALAWALLRAGQVDAAVAEADRILDEAPDGEIQDALSRVSRLKAAAALWRGGERDARRAERDRLDAEVAQLERAVSERLTFEFEHSDDAWWNQQLTALVRDLEAFRDPASGLFSKGFAPGAGLGVPGRRDFAATVEERSLTGDEAVRRWSEAIESIADPARCPAYAGMRLRPQLGLLPLGRDAASGLWEFVHLQSGDPPARDAGGRLLLGAETGIVLVLIPAGRFPMGAQSDDPSRPNFDPMACTEERPVHEVELSAYFLSKYELTAGQWLRSTGIEASILVHRGLRMNAEERPILPATFAARAEAERVLHRMGLVLPTEAQWERAARAGTSTPWWTGSDVASLQGCENLQDLSTRHSVPPTPVDQLQAELDDGYFTYSPVGSLRANPFGLHDMLGNVEEWCQDACNDYTVPARAGDGERIGPRLEGWIARGGNCSSLASEARCARRLRYIRVPELASVSCGLRPALSVSR